MSWRSYNQCYCRKHNNITLYSDKLLTQIKYLNSGCYINGCYILDLNY